MNQQTSSSISENIFKGIIGILIAIGLFDVIYSFAGSYANYGLLYPSAHVLLTIFLFLALSFIWVKERWAVWLFLAIVLAHLGLDFFVGAFSFLKLVLLLPAFYFLAKIK
jgi:hypothetical protein